MGSSLRTSSLALAAVLAFTRAATAQAPATIDCLHYSDGTVTAQNGKPVLCTQDRCALVADPKAKAVSVQPPKAAPASAPASPLKLEKGKASVCVDGTCAALGPKLAAAVDAARKVRAAAKQSADDLLLVTRDRGMVAIDESPRQIWSVGKDQQLAVKPPPKASSTTLADVQVIGDRFLAVWSDGCPANCIDDTTVIDRDGTQIGTKFPSGLLVYLDAQVFVIPTGSAKVTAIDLATGKQLGQVDLIPRGQLERISVTRLDATTAAVAWSINGTTWTLAWLGATKDKPSIRTRSFKMCPP